VGATQAGVKTYDDRYGRFSPSALAPHLAALKSIAAALEETTAQQVEDEIDRTALLNEIRVTLRRFEHERPQAKNPGFWLSHLLGGLHFLLGRRDRTPEERAVSLVGRLEDVPRLLDDARAGLVEPVRVFVETALRVNQGGVSLVREVATGLGERVAAAADVATVSPLPGTADASPQTQISFLGRRGMRVSEVRVVGSLSGVHDGLLRAYSTRTGASFLPYQPFRAGERVFLSGATALQPDGSIRGLGDSAAQTHAAVIAGDGWHRGVIGITATRVLERYNRPTIVISRQGEEAFGSGRSIRAFHLLEALESCSDLFTRYGGHAHACGFALPAANVPQLRARLDAFARARLTLADFDPMLDLDAELPLDEITPALFQALHLLEPYGVGNPEPIFSARGVQLTAPPRILKDKHVKLKLRRGNPANAVNQIPLTVATDEESSDQELSAVAVLVTPNCHPDGAAIRRSEKIASTKGLRIENPEPRTSSWRNSIVFDALGWNMAERLQQSPLLAGDAIDIAFTVGHNDHPEYGGLELSLRDLRTAGSSSKEVVRPTAKTAPAAG